MMYFDRIKSIKTINLIRELKLWQDELISAVYWSSYSKCSSKLPRIVSSRYRSYRSYSSTHQRILRLRIARTAVATEAANSRISKPRWSPKAVRLIVYTPAELGLLHSHRVKMLRSDLPVPDFVDVFLCHAG
jgi:hypothetical protein